MCRGNLSSLVLRRNMPERPKWLTARQRSRSSRDGGIEPEVKARNRRRMLRGGGWKPREGLLGGGCKPRGGPPFVEISIAVRRSEIGLKTPLGGWGRSAALGATAGQHFFDGLRDRAGTLDSQGLSHDGSATPQACIINEDLAPSALGGGTTGKLGAISVGVPGTHPELPRSASTCIRSWLRDSLTRSRLCFRIR